MDKAYWKLVFNVIYWILHTFAEVANAIGEIFSEFKKYEDKDDGKDEKD